MSLIDNSIPGSLLCGGITTVKKKKKRNRQNFGPLRAYILIEDRHTNKI